MRKPLKTLVIATSLGDGSDDVVRTGVALARSTGASPWLVHAYIPAVFPSELGIDTQGIEEQAKMERELLTDQARRTGLSALDGFFPDHVCLAVGAPHRQIVELARRVEADLVVLGAAEAPAGSWARPPTG